MITAECIELCVLAICATCFLCKMIDNSRDGHLRELETERDEAIIYANQWQSLFHDGLNEFSKDLGENAIFVSKEGVEALQEIIKENLEKDVDE